MATISQTWAETTINLTRRGASGSWSQGVVRDMATADDAPATSVTSHEDVLEFWFDGDLDVSTRPRPILLEAPPTLRGKTTAAFND